MKRRLYLGLRPKEDSFIHFPVIKIQPILFCKEEIKHIAHLLFLADFVLFTSQSVVDPLFSLLEKGCSLGVIQEKVIISIGYETACALRKKGIPVDFIPLNASQEGVVELLSTLPSLTNKRFFYGRSSRSRPLIKKFLEEKCCTLFDPILYETRVAFDLSNKPSLEDIEEVIFTSPSTIDGFKEAFSHDILPKNLIMTAIGSVTGKYVQESFPHHKIRISYLLTHNS